MSGAAVACAKTLRRDAGRGDSALHLRCGPQQGERDRAGAGAGVGAGAGGGRNDMRDGFHLYRNGWTDVDLWETS